MTWELAGFELGERVSSDEVIELWQGRSAAGEPVTVRRYLGLAGACDGLRDRCQAIEQLYDEHVVTPRVILADGADLVVVEPADGLSLGKLLDERERLRAAEVVTVLLPLARSLAQAHDIGVVHGQLRPDSVVLSDLGKPLLRGLVVADTSVSALMHTQYADPAGEDSGPAGDVFGLAAIGFRCLTGQPPWNADRVDYAQALVAQATVPAIAKLCPSAPVDLADLLQACLSRDPLARPSAALLAQRLAATVTPAPVRRSRSTAVPASVGPRIRRPQTSQVQAPSSAPGYAAIRRPRKRAAGCASSRCWWQ